LLRFSGQAVASDALLDQHLNFSQRVEDRAIVLYFGLKSLHAIVGASYSGMVALCFAERHAALLRHFHARPGSNIPIRHLLAKSDAEFLGRSMRRIFERNRHGI
jgi:hypothetical protein